MLGLDTPDVIMVGVGCGARVGVLILIASPLQRLERVDTLAVDKAGTLTEGKPALTAIVGRIGGGLTEAGFLRLAASGQAEKIGADHERKIAGMKDWLLNLRNDSGPRR